MRMSNHARLLVVGLALVGCSSPNPIDPKLSVSPTANLTTAEDGTFAQFVVKLTAQPDADVVVPLYSDDPSEGTVDMSELRFTRDDWDRYRIVTVSGVDDPEKDGNQIFHIGFGDSESGDPRFIGLRPGAVQITNFDDDVPNVLVDQTTLDVAEGTFASFHVRLTSRPRDTVALDLSSPVGAPFVVVPARVQIFPNDWETPVAVTVTMSDNDTIDTLNEFAVVLGATESGDADYSGLRPPSVTVRRGDDDHPGLVVSSVPATTAEGASYGFTVRLAVRPLADVTVPISTTSTQVVASASALTFTTANWNITQLVSVTMNSDHYIPRTDPTASVRLGPTQSSDSSYNGLEPKVLSFVVHNTDVAGFTVTASSATQGSTTTEHDLAAFPACKTFVVSLATHPNADVTMTVVSSDPTEGQADPPTLTLTPSSYQRGFKVCGQNDDIVDGNQPFTITVAVQSTTDPDYQLSNKVELSFTNRDDDASGEYCSSPIVLTAGSKQVGQSLADRADDFEIFTCSTNELVGPDAAYSITIPAGQTLTATISNVSFAHSTVYIIGTCDPGHPTCLAYSNGGTQASAKYTNTSTAELPVFIVVDADPAGGGTYDILATLSGP